MLPVILRGCAGRPAGSFDQSGTDGALRTMKRQVILDTGPLVAFLNSRDRYHDWAKAQWAQTGPPRSTCEAVVSEACFLLRVMEPRCSLHL